MEEIDKSELNNVVKKNLMSYYFFRITMKSGRKLDFAVERKDECEDWIRAIEVALLVKGE